MATVSVLGAAVPVASASAATGPSAVNTPIAMTAQPAVQSSVNAGIQAGLNGVQTGLQAGLNGWQTGLQAAQGGWQAGAQAAQAGWQAGAQAAQAGFAAGATALGLPVGVGVGL
jgi:hypothetical protein